MTVENDISLIQQGQRERRERQKKQMRIPSRFTRAQQELLDWATAYYMSRHPERNAVELRKAIEDLVCSFHLSFGEIRQLKFKKEGGLL